jgi:hypothetical protein
MDLMNYSGTSAYKFDPHLTAAVFDCEKKKKNQRHACSEHVEIFFPPYFSLKKGQLSYGW